MSHHLKNVKSLFRYPFQQYYEWKLNKGLKQLILKI